MEPHIEYFRLVVADPDCTPSWADWWAANEELVQRTFPLIEYVRLKHRGPEGVRQLLQKYGHIPRDPE